MVLEKVRANSMKEGQLAVVIGAGRSGMAAIKVLLKHNMRVRLLEQDKNAIDNNFRELALKAGVRIIYGELTPDYLGDANYIIPSPALALSKLKAIVPASCTAEILGEIELAWRFMGNEPVLAVTGTSGKTTTVSIAAAMLSAQGLSVFLGGNIGTPLCEYILAEQKADAVVVEVSSFQLQTCSTFCPKVAVFLNVSENHLDYHADMKEYISAKLRLFRCQEREDIAIFGRSLKPIVNTMNLKARLKYIALDNSFTNVQLLGEHNLFNIEAAWLACKEFGITKENAQKAVAAFKPLPNRLERVAVKSGILYVNDSKCTTVSSLKVALESFKSSVILLCGGKFKGGDLSKLRELVQSKVKHIALFGDSREHFEKAFAGLKPMSWDAKLDLAMGRVRGIATKGDVVLLSPATASFDLYKNYEERGKDFRRIVGSIK